MRVDAPATSYTTKIDVFSTMLVVWECWSCRRAYSDSFELNRAELNSYVKRGNLPSLSHFPPFLEAFVKFGLEMDPDKRPDASQLFDILLNEEHVLENIQDSRYQNDAAVPFLFGESFESVFASIMAKSPTAAMDGAGDDDGDSNPGIRSRAEVDLQHALNGLIYLIANCPCFLLPPKTYTGLLNKMHELLEASEQTNPFAVVVAWEQYAPPLMLKLQNFILLGGDAHIEAIVTIIALFTSIANKSAKMQFLELFVAESQNDDDDEGDIQELMSCLLTILTTPQLRHRCSTWSMTGLLKVMADVIAVCQVGKYFTKESTLEVVATLNEISGNPMLHRQSSSIQNGYVDVVPEEDSLPEEDSYDNALLTQVARLSTQLCALGHVHSSLPVRRIISDSGLIGRLLKHDTDPKHGTDLVFHLSRLLCVTRAAVAIETENGTVDESDLSVRRLTEWLVTIPWNDVPRRENTDDVDVLHQGSLVSHRLHTAIIDAILVQVSAEISANSDALALVLYAVYANHNIASDAEVDTTTLLNMVDGKQVLHPELPAPLRIFKDASSGCEVLAGLLQECADGTKIDEHLSGKTLWICVHLVYICLTTLSKAWPPKASGAASLAMCKGAIKKFAAKGAEAEIPRLLAELIPTLIDVANGRQASELGGFRPLAAKAGSALYARDVVAQLVTPPSLCLLDEYQSDEASEFFLAGLSSFLLMHNTGVTRTLKNDEVQLMELAYMGLWHLASNNAPFADKIRAKLAGSPVFKPMVMLTLGAEAATAYNFPNFKFVVQLSRFTPHVSTFFSYPEIARQCMILWNDPPVDVAHCMASFLKATTSAYKPEDPGYYLTDIPARDIGGALFKKIPCPSLQLCCKMIIACLDDRRKCIRFHNKLACAMLGMIDCDDDPEASAVPWQELDPPAQFTPESYVFLSLAKLLNTLLLKKPVSSVDVQCFTEMLLRLWLWIKKVVPDTMVEQVKALNGLTEKCIRALFVE